MKQKKEAKKEVIKKLKKRYHLKMVREANLEEVMALHVTRFSIYLIISAVILITVGVVAASIAFTPLRQLIPGYPDSKLQKMIVYNAQMVDSLSNELLIRDQYLQSIQDIMRGSEPPSHQNPHDTFQNYEHIDFSISKDDSLLREQVEQESQFSIAQVNGEMVANDLSRVHFYPPLKGIVTNEFDMLQNHYGTDIVAKPNQVVSVVLDGTVIEATWSVEFGYIIHVQHEHNLVSAYKHNSELLKTVGSHVKVGEPIAIIGNSGELTWGPHLHFELWFNGTPIDPEKYINF
ncbi:MAG: M23 family metallopeptidase [Bacteroidales bacterium]|nr:M23 family metallopeptidase [Bacteroidales bacterium]MCF8457242.1 M23 family metallopeptidase [Bacteroidales bacterium]